MVFDHVGECESESAAIKSIADKSGMTPETLRTWIQHAETDSRMRRGLTTSQRVRMKELEREDRELRRANEILKSVAPFFGAELGRRQVRLV